MVKRDICQSRMRLVTSGIIRILPFVLLLFTAGTEMVWSDCELEQLGCVRLQYVENTTGDWTFDSVTTFLVICCTCGLWITPGMTELTVVGATCWKSCCWPAEKQNPENIRSSIRVSISHPKTLERKFTWNNGKFGPRGVRGSKGGNQASGTWQLWRSDNKALTQTHTTSH